MNDTPIRGVFADKLPRAKSYRAWRVGGYGTAYPIELRGEPEDTNLALEAALASGHLQHKHTLLIHMHDDAAGKGVLYAWKIQRKSNPRYVRGDDGTSKPFYELYPTPICSFEVDRFEPTRPFDALRDPASGRDPNVVAGQ